MYRRHGQAAAAIRPWRGATTPASCSQLVHVPGSRFVRDVALLTPFRSLSSSLSSSALVLLRGSRLLVGVAVVVVVAIMTSTVAAAAAAVVCWCSIVIRSTRSPSYCGCRTCCGLIVLPSFPLCVALELRVGTAVGVGGVHRRLIEYHCLLRGLVALLREISPWRFLLV